MGIAEAAGDTVNAITAFTYISPDPPPSAIWSPSSPLIHSRIIPSVIAPLPAASSLGTRTAAGTHESQAIVPSPYCLRARGKRLEALGSQCPLVIAWGDSLS